MKAIFNEQETDVLKNMVQDGGILIRIPNNHNHCSTILKEDGNGEFKTIGFLDQEISIKLFELYCDPTPLGYHLVSLRACIENFC